MTDKSLPLDAPLSPPSCVGNPYSPPEAETAPAELAQQPVGLPHPNLFVAILLALAPVAAQFVVSIAVMVIAAVVMGIRRGNVESIEQLAESVNYLLLPLATLTNLGVALLIVAIAFGREAPRRVAWRNCTAFQWLATLLLVIPLAIIASEVSNCAGHLLSLIEPAWLEEFRASNGQLFEEFSQESWLLVFVGACLLPGLGEELYCRGLIGRGLVGRYGVWFGVLFTSLLFGLMHLEPVQATSAFVLGLALNYLFLVTRSLPAAIVLHLLNNLGAFAVMRLDGHVYVPGLSLSPDESIVHTPPLLVVASLAATAAIGAVLYQTRTRWLLPDGSAWSPGYVTAESPPRGLAAQAHTAQPKLAMITFALVCFTALIAALVLFTSSPA